MKKNSILELVALAFITVSVGCGGENAAPNPTTPPPAANTAPENISKEVGAYFSFTAEAVNSASTLSACINVASFASFLQTYPGGTNKSDVPLSSYNCDDQLQPIQSKLTYAVDFTHTKPFDVEYNGHYEVDLGITIEPGIVSVKASGKKTDLTLNGKNIDFSNAVLEIKKGDFGQPVCSGAVAYQGKTCKIVEDCKSCSY